MRRRRKRWQSICCWTNESKAWHQPRPRQKEDEKEEKDEEVAFNFFGRQIKANLGWVQKRRSVGVDLLAEKMILQSSLKRKMQTQQRGKH